jgi:hypothetical protein
MTARVWMLVGAGPARFSDEHGIWQRTVEVFSSREIAMSELEARIPGLVWRRANRLQGFLIGEDGAGTQWALMSCRVDEEGRRYTCHSGQHAYHRTRANALECKADAERLVVA